jgi:signal transduction histidine kinase
VIGYAISRGSEVPGETLQEALGQVAAELAFDESVAFRSIVDGTSRELDPTAHFEAYHIGREALLNAFAHAQARTIDVQIVYGLNSLRLRVSRRRPGHCARRCRCGVTPGHWGLVGMRERAQRLGRRSISGPRAGAGTQGRADHSGQQGLPARDAPHALDPIARADGSHGDGRIKEGP